MKMFQINYYAIQQGRCFPIKSSDLYSLNENKADIYWTPNNFSAFGKRKKEDLREITSFYCEIDSSDKEQQLKAIKKTGLTPSCVIETKRGFHIYWYLKVPIDCSPDPTGYADRFRDIVANRICPALNADTQAADACRILRAAFFRYWKDSLGTFYSDIVFESKKKYCKEEILEAFPIKKNIENFQQKKRELFTNGSDNFWEAANRLDVISGLQKLSGTPSVGMEIYSFKKQNKITRIICNNKACNAWIDENGLIGSTDGGGPALPNWLFWYHKDWKVVARFLKEHFEELRNL